MASILSQLVFASWFISSLTPYGVSKAYKDNSSAGLLVYFPTDSVYFIDKYIENCSVELLVYFITDLMLS